MNDQRMVERVAAFRDEVTSAGLGNVAARSTRELGELVFELLDMLGDIADDLGVERTTREDSINDDAEQAGYDRGWGDRGEEANYEWRAAVLAYFDRAVDLGEVVTVADRWDADAVARAIHGSVNL